MDVPILLLDFLRKRGGSSGIQLIRALSRSHPSKVLFMGADYLLSVFFRGCVERQELPEKDSAGVSMNEGSFGVSLETMSMQKLSPVGLV
jgi:hypothetical protein